MCQIYFWSRRFIQSDPNCIYYTIKDAAFQSVFDIFFRHAAGSAGTWRFIQIHLWNNCRNRNVLLTARHNAGVTVTFFANVSCAYCPSRHATATRQEARERDVPSKAAFGEYDITDTFLQRRARSRGNKGSFIKRGSPGQKPICQINSAFRIPNYSYERSLIYIGNTAQFAAHALLAYCSVSLPKNQHPYVSMRTDYPTWRKTWLRNPHTWIMRYCL